MYPKSSPKLETCSEGYEFTISIISLFEKSFIVDFSNLFLLSYVLLCLTWYGANDSIILPLESYVLIKPFVLLDNLVFNKLSS